MLLFPVLLSGRGQIVPDLMGKHNLQIAVTIFLATRSEELWKLSVFSVQ